MTTPTPQPNGKANGHANGAPNGGAPPKRQSDHEKNLDLARKMGATSYNPIPPDQHNCWRKLENISEGVVRMWSLMTHLCLDFGHRSPYAIVTDERGNQRPATIDDLALMLDMDEANARKYWTDGVASGLWRNGSQHEGKSKLFLSGRVRPVKAPETGEDQANGKGMRIPFQRWIWNQIKDWPAERLAAFVAEEETERNIMDVQLRADLDAARRAIISQREHTRFAAAGILVFPQKGHEFTDEQQAAEHQARQARLREVLLPALAPLVERYAHTFLGSAQTSENGLREVPDEVYADPATFMSQTSSRQLPDVGACERPLGPLAAHKTPSREGQKPNGYLPAGDPALEARDEDERNAVALLFTKAREMQQAFPHTRFGDVLVDAENKADQLWSGRILVEIRDSREPDLTCTQKMQGYLYDCGVRFGVGDRNALGKLPRPTHSPATNPEERYIGLMLDWAVDYRKGAAQRVQHRAEFAEREQKRQAFEAALEQRRTAEYTLRDRVESTWAEMSTEEKLGRITQARAALKADPHWRQWSSDQRNSNTEVYARNLLRNELAGGAQ